MTSNCCAPDSELPEEHERADDATGGSDKVSGSEESRTRKYHDVRASIAIVNGYSQALGSSFSELKQHYDDLLGVDSDHHDPDSLAALRTMEADCRYCLSQLSRSVTQLRERLDAGKGDDDRSTAMENT